MYKGLGLTYCIKRVIKVVPLKLPIGQFVHETAKQGVVSHLANIVYT